MKVYIIECVEDGWFCGDPFRDSVVKEVCLTEEKAVSELERIFKKRITKLLDEGYTCTEPVEDNKSISIYTKLNEHDFRDVEYTSVGYVFYEMEIVE